MEATSHDFVLAGDGRPPADVVRAALAPRFTVAPAGRSRTLRLSWLDTFDWRLHRAGLTLQHSTGSRISEYTLTSNDGEQITASVGGLRWPALADALPPGPLRARLQPVTWVRALMPIARATATVRPLRLLNADDKTIAWLTVSQLSLTGPGAADLPSRLSVTAVRGYQAQTDRIVRHLTAAAGVTPALRSPLGSALAAAGRRPGDYSGKIDVELTAEHAGPVRDAGGAAPAARHPRGERARRGAGRGHRVPARPARRGAAHQVGDQAVRRRAGGRGARRSSVASSNGSAT